MALRRLLGLLTLLVASACSAAPVSLPEAPPGSLRVGIYNAHYIILSKETGAWSIGDWERRKEPMAAAVKALDADIIGFQEMETFSHGSDGSTNLALDWLREQNPDYGVAAVGDWQIFPSTQPIFYRKARLELLEQGWFFFSETPDEIYSRTFNGSYPAFASWADFREREGTGAPFRVVNVHFDFRSRLNRRKSAELVAARVAPLIAAGRPVFVIGDINAGTESEPADILKAVGLRFSPVSGATYHWNRGLNLTGPVDHLAYSAGIAPLGAPVVLRQKFMGEWPTDHYPVIGDFRLE